MRRDLFVFAGQSNMMGAAVYPPKKELYVKDSYEYKHKPRCSGMPKGSFVPAGYPVGEFSYVDMQRAYAPDMIDETGKSKLSDYRANTYFCPSMSSLVSEGDKTTLPFSEFSEATAQNGATLAPFIAEEWEKLGYSCAYAHIAKGSIRIAHYMTDDMAAEYSRRMKKFNQAHDTCFAEVIPSDPQMAGAADYFLQKCKDFFKDAKVEFPNDDNKPYKSNKGKLVYNEFLKKEIPINWSIRLLKDCVSSDKYAIVDGPFGTQLKIEEYVSEGIPIFEMEQLNGGLIVEPNKHYITMEKYNTIKRSTVKTGDIIISKTGTLGLLGIVDKNCDKGIIVSRLAKISPDNNKIGQYTLLTILKQLEKNGYWDKKSTGSTMPILNNKILENVEILYPDNNLFVKFENKIKNLYKLIFKCQRENINLEKNRKKILPLLMNNQIKIEDI